MAADVRGGAFEGKAAVKLIGQEAEVGCGVGGESEAQKVLRLLWPGGGVIAARWSQRKPASCGEPLGLEGVKAGSTYSEPDTGLRGGELAVIESGEGSLHDLERQTVKELFVCIRDMWPWLGLSSQR